jgi:hypothetical protein
MTAEEIILSPEVWVLIAILTLLALGGISWVVSSIGGDIADVIDRWRP